MAACSPSQFRIEVEFRLQRGASDEKVTHNNTTVRANSSILEVLAMGRRAVHVSVNKALAVCDGFSKLLKTLRQRHKVTCVSVTPARIFISGVGIAV